MSATRDVAKRENKLQLPPGLSEDEEAQWWYEHPEYWEQTDTEDELVSLNIRPSARVPLWLPVDMIEALKKEAERQRIVYQSVIRIWLNERLQAEAEKAKPRKSTRRK